MGRAKYYVTFIDDCSRYCAKIENTYKSDVVIRIFKEYKARMQKQTERNAKCLMSDNGGE